MKLVQYWISRELSSFSCSDGFSWNIKDDEIFVHNECYVSHLNQILRWVIKGPGTHQELYFITLITANMKSSHRIPSVLSVITKW